MNVENGSKIYSSKLEGIKRIFKAVRDSLFNSFNKEFLIFLFFLALSTGYWMMSVLNDTMERDIAIPLRLTNIPRNVIVINDSDYMVHVVLRDKGYTLATYYFSDHTQTLEADFDRYVVSRDRVIIPATEIQKMLSGILFKSTKIVSVKTDHITYLYNFGQHKRVPVRLSGTITPHDAYYLARTVLQPDSVDVYATTSKLDSIHEIYTKRVEITDFEDTVRQDVELRHIAGTKIQPATIRMLLIPDVMTEMHISVAVTPVHVPRGRRLRTFPTHVNVKYVVGASQYHSIDSAAFLVTADYRSTNNGTTEKCQLRLVRAPRLARSPRLTETKVGYLLEQ